MALTLLLISIAMKHVTLTYAYWQIYEILNFKFCAFWHRNEILFWILCLLAEKWNTELWILCLLVEKWNTVLNSLPTGREMKYYFEFFTYRQRNEILSFEFSAYWQRNKILFWILCLLAEKWNTELWNIKVEVTCKLLGRYWVG